MSLIARIVRVVRNPAAYWACLGRKWRQTRLHVFIYRFVTLPLALRRVRRKSDPINVIFLAMTPAMWRYDGVYRRLREDKRFNPTIVTAVSVCQTVQEQLATQKELVRFFREKGYEVVEGTDCERGRGIDLKPLRPDIVFFTQPYEFGPAREFLYTRYPRTLFCYASYSFQFSQAAWNWNNPIQNIAWRHYVVSRYQRRVCERFSNARAVNAVMSGYSFEEDYREAVLRPDLADAAWRGDCRKRVIWAPHCSIRPTTMFKVSSFLDIADLMEKLRDRYADRIVFAFKPHPFLLGALREVWGEDRANAYYDRWRESENSFVSDGEYKALFAGSDAMLHCSGSFIAEYLYTNKPVMYVYGSDRNPPDLGELGDAALGAHYSARQFESDIVRFLDEVVLGGADGLRARREAVSEEYLRAPNGHMFSENVVEDILAELKKS